MSVNMEELARLAGVSRPTVSKALAGKDRVSARTRQRILELAAKMNFVPSGAAQAFRRGTTQMVGVYYSHGGLPGPWSMSVLGGVDRYLRSRQYHLIVVTHATDDDEVPRVVRQRFVDAMLIVHERDAKLESFMKESGIPFVAVNAGRAFDCDCVVPDNARGMKTAVDHLVRLGHSRIGFVGTPTPRHISAHERAVGYAEAVSAHGLVALPGYSEHVPVAVRVRALLDAPAPPTALVCYNDEIAMEVIACLGGQGISVPGQVSVVGCDNLSHAVQFFSPPLTTLNMPFEQIGEKAAELLMERLANPEAPPRAVVVSNLDLVVRGSTSRAVE
jgi:LacI family transcriptional regulator